MKKFYAIVLVILSLIITQQTFPQKENAKGPLTGEQQIELIEGYSFVSSRIIPENPNMLDVLQNNLENLDFVRNSAGLMLRKIGPNWINSIGNWINTEGYLFKMISGDNLIITGDVIDPQTPVELSIGYQIIGYLPNEALNTEDIFQDILENLEFVRNTAGLMFRKIGPVWVNSIGLMQPGEAYLVKMLADDVLIYPGSSSFTCGNLLIDSRDGQTYQTVQIGTQCWMAENLNIGTRIDGVEEMTDNGLIEKYCYDNSPINCLTYGGLYQWNEMMQYMAASGLQGICPVGWRIPSDDIWKILEGTVDSQYPVGDPIWNNTGWRGFDAGINLKSTSGWNDNGNGTDLFGFTALPCGYRVYDGSFINIGNYSRFWSSTEHLNVLVRNRHLRYLNDEIYRYNNNKDYGYSVRCLKDETTPVNQPPEPPSSPNPEDGAVNQSIEVDLSWTCTDPEGDPLTYDVYLGTESNPSQVASGQTETTYDLETLENNTEYFWKIIAHDDHSNTTEGPVWSFTTEESTQWQCGDPFTDSRDEQIYNSVQIGEQCWMAENLNIGEMIDGIEEMTDNGVIEKYCYDDNPVNCDEYGGFYQWNEMMQYMAASGLQGICPVGWRIPSDDIWKILEGTVDSQYPVGDPIWNNTGWRGFDAGINLKSTSGWNDNGNGTDLFGFTALPCGYRVYDGSFINIGNYSRFWSSTEHLNVLVRNRHLRYLNDEIYRYNNNKDYGYSVRCLKDETTPVNQPPEPPSSPIPEHGAENQSIEIDLSWTCTDPEGDPLTYDIYFGTGVTPPEVATGQTQTTYDPGILETNTEYFWKIVAHDDHSNTTEGTIWSFTTEEEQFTCGDPFTDLRDGQTYNTVQIGDQCWMAENMNIGTMINGSEEMIENGVIEKYCYNDNTENCDEYGGLYQWNEMMQYTTIPGVQGICPDGWHIPTDDEWKILEGTVDSQYPVGDPIWNNTGYRGFDACLNLKSINGWYSGGNGNDLFDFTTLPVGYRHFNGYFSSLGNVGDFWSSTEYDINNAWARGLHYNSDGVFRVAINSNYGFSVRCLMDGYTPINQPPEPPSSPNPEDGVENQSIEVDILWTCTDPEGDPLTYDIHFGTEATPPQVTTGQTETTYDPGILENNTEYFWKIIAHDDHSNTTEGSIWSFTTEEEQFTCGDPFTDTRDGQNYNTVQIGNQCWMAENLNIGSMINGGENMNDDGIIEKYCYDNSTANCYEYGGLYQWNEMMQYVLDSAVQGICPTGWYIPTDYEWKILEGTVDSQYPVGDPIWENWGTRGYDAGLNLKSTSGWDLNGNGTDAYGFTALPGGYYNADGNFYSLTLYVHFWSSSNSAGSAAWRRRVNYMYDGVNRYTHYKYDGFSVRCLKD